MYERNYLGGGWFGRLRTGMSIEEAKAKAAASDRRGHNFKSKNRRVADAPKVSEEQTGGLDPSLACTD